MEFTINNNRTMRLEEIIGSEDIKLTTFSKKTMKADLELTISAGDMVMLMNHYHNCLESGQPIVTDFSKTHLELFIEEEVPFRLDMFHADTVNKNDANYESIVNACTRGLQNDTDMMFDYDEIDRFIENCIAEHMEPLDQWSLWLYTKKSTSFLKNIYKNKKEKYI